MINEQHKTHAEAESLCNVYTFIGTGEGRTVSRLEVMHIKSKYRYVEQWYAALDQEGQQRVDQFLAKISVDTWPATLEKILNTGGAHDQGTD